MKQLIFYFNNFFCSGHFLVIFSDLMDQKNGRSQKIPKSKISAFSCLSTTRRNFWNSFILRPYFQSCFPELQIAHTVSVLQIFCRNLTQWLLRTYYFLKWVSPAEFPFSGLRYSRTFIYLRYWIFVWSKNWTFVYQWTFISRGTELLSTNFTELSFRL